MLLPAESRWVSLSMSSDGIYTSFPFAKVFTILSPIVLKRLVTRNAIDYLEKQCTIVCRTCAPRNDSPFFVQEQNDLTSIIKANHQHAFVDIVKMAALKEIDNTIKYLVKIRSLNIRTKQRSNTSSNIPPEPTTAPVGNLNRRGERRRNSFDSDGCRGRRSESPRRIFFRSALRRTSGFECHWN